MQLSAAARLAGSGPDSQLQPARGGGLGDAERQQIICSLQALPPSLLQALAALVVPPGGSAGPLGSNSFQALHTEPAAEAASSPNHHHHLQHLQQQQQHASAFANSQQDPSVSLQLVMAAFHAGAAAAAAAAGQQQQHNTMRAGSLEAASSGELSRGSPFAISPHSLAAASQITHDASPTAAAAAAAAAATAPAAMAADAPQQAPASPRFRGVFWDRKNQRWRSQVGHHGRKMFLGYHAQPADAARAYDRAVVQLHGALAKTNFPLEEYAEALQLHRQLHSHEGGAQLLQLPLEQLQAHLQAHIATLKQPAGHAQLPHQHQQQQQQATSHGAEDDDDDPGSSSLSAGHPETEALARSSSRLLPAKRRLSDGGSSSDSDVLECHTDSLPGALAGGQPARQQAARRQHSSSPPPGPGTAAPNLQDAGQRSSPAAAGSSRLPGRDTRSLEQHLLTRLHEQKRQQLSSSACPNIDVLLAAAAVAAEEDAATAAAEQQQQQQPAGVGQGSQACAPPQAMRGMPPPRDRPAPPHPSGVVTDRSAVLHAILRQQGPAGGGSGSTPAARGERRPLPPPLAALHRHLLQPPTSAQHFAEAIHLAHQAGLGQQAQQLLLVVMHQQLLDLHRRPGHVAGSSAR